MKAYLMTGLLVASLAVVAGSAQAQEEVRKRLKAPLTQRARRLWVLPTQQVKRLKAPR